MNNKTIVAIILVSLLVFHKQLNINLGYIILAAIILAIFSVKTGMSYEGFEEDDQEVVLTEKIPVAKNTREDEYTINRNINAPDQVGGGMVNDGDDYTVNDTGGYNDSGTGLGRTDSSTIRAYTIDKSGNIWSTSNFGIDGDSRVKGSLAVDMDANVKGNLDIDGPSVLHDNVKMLRDTNMLGKLNVGDYANFGSKTNFVGPSNYESSISVTGPATYRGTMNVSGNSKFHNNLAVDQNQVIGGDLGVIGNTKLASDVEIGNNQMIGKNNIIGGNLSVQGSVGKGFEKSKMVNLSDNGWGKIIEKRCPPNHFMCGLKIRHEYYDEKTKQDNTGINGVSLQCCPFE